jgi:hypothetical protein
MQRSCLRRDKDPMRDFLISPLIGTQWMRKKESASENWPSFNLLWLGISGSQAAIPFLHRFMPRFTSEMPTHRVQSWVRFINVWLRAGLGCPDVSTGSVTIRNRITHASFIVSICARLWSTSSCVMWDCYLQYYSLWNSGLLMLLWSHTVIWSS